MHPFNYVAPKTVEEAVSVLEKHGDKARPLAGGTDLLVQARGNKWDLEAVVDVKKIPEAMKLEASNDGLIIGSGVPCYQIYENEEVKKHYACIVDGAFIIGGIQIQSRAAVGGNLCNAAPSADAVPVLIATRATCNVASSNGTRSIPVEDFCTGPGQNILNPDELLVSLSFPKHGPNFGSRYIRFIPRNEMDIAVAGAGVSITLDNEVIKSIHVALASVAPTPILVKKITEELTGTNLTPETLSRAGELAKEAATPITDMRGTIEYRKHLSDVLTKRALADAIKRAQGGKVNGR